MIQTFKLLTKHNGMPFFLFGVMEYIFSFSFVLLMCFLTLCSYTFNLSAQSTSPLRISTQNLGAVVCGNSLDRTLILTNTTTDTITIRRMNVGLPFAIIDSQQTQQTRVAPSQQLQVRVRYTPELSPRIDSSTLRIEYVKNQTQNIAVLLERSSNMALPLNGSAENRVVMAKERIKDFLRRRLLQRNRSNADTIAIYSFSDTTNSKLPFTIEHDFTTDTSRIGAALDSIDISGNRWLYDALIQTSNRIQRKQLPLTIVVYSGDNTAELPPNRADVENAVLSSGSKVCVIHLKNSASDVENDAPFLRDLCAKTFGQFYDIENHEAFRESIDSLLAIADISAQDFSLIAESIPANITASFESNITDSTLVGKTGCTSVMITNNTTLAVRLNPSMLKIESTQWRIDTTVLSQRPQLLPSENLRIPVCFTPQRRGNDSAELTFRFGQCSPAQQLLVRGVSYDSLILIATILDRDVLPNSTIRMRIHTKGTLPNDYRIPTLRYTLRFDATMLDTTNTAEILRSGVALTSTSALSTSLQIVGDTGLYTVTITGSQFVLSSADTLIAEQHFFALFPTSLTTKVFIEDIRFADRFVRTSVEQAPALTFNDVCFLDKRLLDTRLRRNTLLNIFHIEQNSEQVISLSILNSSLPHTATLTICDMMGNSIDNKKVELLEGVTNYTLGLPQLPQGCYLFSVSSTAGVSSVILPIWK